MSTCLSSIYIHFWVTSHLFQVAENLAQLMYSVMMTGYMFKNAQYRLELQQSLEQVALPEVQDKKVISFFLFFIYKLKYIYFWSLKKQSCE